MTAMTAMTATMRAFRQVALVALMALSTSARTDAQDRPVVFVHGFGSSGETWTGAAGRLQSTLAIQPATPSLNATALYETQADDLQWQVGGFGADTIAVGHSNGGLIARQWNRQHPLAGVITVGTPHAGAPLVRNLSAYAGFNWALVWSVNDVFRLFGQGCCDWHWILSAYSTIWQLAADMAASSLPEIASAVAVNAAFPVTPEMAPGSGFLASMNSNGNLAREAAAVPVRAGIVSTAYNFYWGGALRAAFPDDGDLVAYWRDAARFGMETYAAYIYANAPYEDWWAFDIAAGLSTAAWYLTVMDEWWCQSVSVVGLGVCWVNDTIVPQWSQVYPGGLYVDAGWQGPAHTQETRMSDALIDRVLTTYLAVPARSSTPQPSGDEATFYSDIEFSGGSLSTSGDLSFVGWDWNDSVSSVHVPPGRTVVLYEHADFEGESLEISADDADLRNHAGPGPDGTWNDVASSIRVF
jgi:pimeloyl-ACP methyl ester carboxylesterase